MGSSRMDQFLARIKSKFDHRKFQAGIQIGEPPEMDQLFSK